MFPHLNQRIRPLLLSIFASVLALPALAQQPVAPSCQPGWLPMAGGEPGTHGTINAVVEFDEGNGPVLFAGGQFTDIGGIPATGIARWDGSHWSAVGAGLGGVWNFEVYTLAVFNDGAGRALYAGGSFTTAGGGAGSGIAQGDCLDWAPLGRGLGSPPNAFGVYDAGTGAGVLAGGAGPLWAVGSRAS